LQWQYKRLDDSQHAVMLSTRKFSNSLPITLGFDCSDTLLGGGVSFGSLSYTPGWLMLDDNLRATDFDTAQTEGRFYRINLDLARTQSLPLPGLGLHARLSVQHAGGKNLDSSEGFGLGGASGVRAYPVGEGFGDGGWVSQVELRYSLGPLTPFVFYDAGRVTVNASPWTAEDNDRSLAGAGLGLRYQRGPLSADLAFAWRTRGGMPEADNQVRNPRAWGSLAYRF
jgi:hemolysin activation/secretion protein